MSLKPYPPRGSGWFIEGVQVPRPVVAIDIDGTLGDYYSHFLAFARLWLGKEIPCDYDGEVSLSSWCGVSKATYRKVKLGYRQGGMKRSMPCYEGASELTRVLRKTGAEVALCTTRPYLHLSNIEPDTVHWLRRNRIQYDNIIMGENKYRDLVAMYGRSRVAMVVDDLPELLCQADELNLPTVLRRQSHNATTEWRREALFLHEVQAIGLALIKQWEQVNR